VPKTVRVAVLVNPANAANTETTLQAAPYAARALRLKIQVFKTSSIREI
jgi:methionyl-tRNA formyltransferase